MAVGAVGAIVGARRGKRRPLPKTNVSTERSKAYEEVLKKAAANKALMTKYDMNQSGKLEEDQVKQLLTDMDSSTPAGTAPSDLELQFIIKVADKEYDGCLMQGEIDFALKAWAILTKKRTEIEWAMDKFDKSCTGKLEKNELKEYLTSLNGGIPVEDEEVDWVLEQADVFGDGAITKPELTKATAAWYSCVKKKEEEKGSCTLQ